VRTGAEDAEAEVWDDREGALPKNDGVDRPLELERPPLVRDRAIVGKKRRQREEKRREEDEASKAKLRLRLKLRLLTDEKRKRE